MRLLLIRHGQTPNNVAGALDTAAPGAGLTPLGQAQARALPAALADEDISAVHASPLLRARLTAAPLADARGLTVGVRAGLEEVSAGALEMRSDTEAVQAYVACLAAWMAEDLDRPMPGGPDGHAFAARYDAAVRDVLADHKQDDTVALVSHGAAIRVWTALRTGIDRDEATRLHLANTGFAVLTGDPGEGWTLARWHEQPAGGTGLDDAAARDVTGDSPDEVVAQD